MVAIPHWPPFAGVRDITLGLERVTAALQRLDNPHQKLPPVIHVAGTNGKGSVMAFLRAILEHAGYGCHVYTSPHLVEFNERVVLSGKLIADDVLYDALERCREASAQVPAIPLSFFEGTTLAAFLAFAESPADVLLLETGLGGRLDATNVVSSPLCTVITPIGMDHQDYLGNDLLKIAAEKAGIMKRGAPCFVGHQSADVLKLLENKASDIGCEITSLQYLSENERERIPALIPDKLPLPGEHQRENAALAALVAKELAKKLPVTDQQIKAGLSKACWPGRLQRIEQGKLAELANAAIWLDGAHNVPAWQGLAEFIDTELCHDVVLIVGMLANRKPLELVGQVRERETPIIAVAIPDDPASLPAETLKKSLAGSYPNIVTAAGITEAVTMANQYNKAHILFAGSLHLIGCVLAESNK